MFRFLSSCCRNKLIHGAYDVLSQAWLDKSGWNGGWPETIPIKSALSIVYLGLIGSAIGFPLYFYLLKKLAPERVAIVTLITPITALLLGAIFNDEVITSKVWLGTALILTGLAIYEYGKYLPHVKKWKIRWLQRPL